MNSSPLNPEAPVFVPGGADSPLLGDHLIAESPRKPLPIDDGEPDSTVFASEAGHRPASPADNLDQILHLNGDNKLMLEGMERVQRDTTLLCDVSPVTPLAAHVNQELLERLQSKERDPMSMSFYGEREEEPPSELDHVQPLPDSEDDEPESNKLLFEQIPETPHGKIPPSAPVEFVAGYAQLIADPVAQESTELALEPKHSIPEPTGVALESQDQATDQTDFMFESKDQDRELLSESRDNGPDFSQLSRENPFGKESSDFLIENKNFVLTNEPTHFSPESAKLEPQRSEAVQESADFVIEAIKSEPANLIDQLSQLSLEPKQPLSESPGFTNGELNEFIQEQSDIMDERKAMSEFNDTKNEPEEIAPEAVSAFVEQELSAKSVIMTPETVETFAQPIQPSENPHMQDFTEIESVPHYNEKISEPTPVEAVSEPTNILDAPTEFVPKDRVEFESETMFITHHGDFQSESMEPVPREVMQEPAETSEPANIIDESANLADKPELHILVSNGFLHENTEYETEQKHVIPESEDVEPKTEFLSEVIPEPTLEPTEPTPESSEPAPEPSEPAPERSEPTPEPSVPASEPSKLVSEPGELAQEPCDRIPKSTNVLSESADVASVPVELIEEPSSLVSTEPEKADIPVVKDSDEFVLEFSAAEVGVVVAGLATVATAGAVTAVTATPSTKKSTPAAKSAAKTPISKMPTSKTPTLKAVTPAAKTTTPASKSGTPATKSTTPATKPKVTNATSKPTNLTAKSALAPKTSAAPTKTAPVSKITTALTKTTTKTTTAAPKATSGTSRLSTTASKPAAVSSKPTSATAKTPAAPRPSTASSKPTSATSRPTTATSKPTTVAPKIAPSKTTAAPKLASIASKPAATASKLTNVASKTTTTSKTTTVASKTTSVASKTTITTSRATTATLKTTATAPRTAPVLKNGPARPAPASAKRLTNGDAKPASKTTAMPPPIRRQTGDKSSKELANKRLSASAAPEKSAESVASDTARPPSPLLPDVVA